MPRIRRDDPVKLIRLALVGLDAQIAGLRETRTQLAAMIDQSPMTPAVQVAAPQKRRKLSAEAKEKISVPSVSWYAGYDLRGATFSP